MNTSDDMTQTPGPDGQEAAFELRPVTLDDLDTLEVIEQCAFAHSPWSRRELEEELNGHDRVYLMAVRDAEPVGYGGAYLGIDAAEIMTLAVLQHARGTGIGRAILERLIAAAVAGGSRQVMLEVGVENDPALSLYRSLGFERVSIRRGYYAPAGGDAFVMRLELR
jgi:ribosomal-protein-alanine N-acetyltransferase